MFDMHCSTSELVSVLEVGMVKPFAMVKVRPLSLREHQTVLLGEELADVVDQSCGRVLIRFDDGADVCASGLNELIMQSRRCEALGGRMVVVGMSRPMRKLIKGTGLDRHLHMEKTTADGMKWFDKRRESEAA